MRKRYSYEMTEDLMIKLFTEELRSVFRQYRKSNALGSAIQAEIRSWRRHVDHTTQSQIEHMILAELTKLGPVQAALAASYVIGATPRPGECTDLAQQHCNGQKWIVSRIKDDVELAVDLLGMGFAAKVLKERGLRKQFERVRAYAEICHWEWEKLKRHTYHREEYAFDESVDCLEITM